VSSPHREEKNWRFAHYLPVFDCREIGENLFHVVASRLFGDTSNEIFTSCGVKPPRGCFAVAILRFSPRHVRAPRSRRRRWERRRVGRKEKEEEREHKVWVTMVKSKVWNRTAGFQGCSIQTETTKRSLTSPRLGCGFSVRFSLFFPPHHSAFLSLSRSVLSFSLPSCTLFSLYLATRVRSSGLRSLARSFALILRSWSSLSFFHQGRRLWAPRAPGKRSSYR